MFRLQWFVKTETNIKFDWQRPAVTSSTICQAIPGSIHSKPSLTSSTSSVIVPIISLEGQMVKWSYTHSIRCFKEVVMIYPLISWSKFEVKVSASFEPNLDLTPEIRTEIGYSARRGGCYEVKRSSPKGEKISHGVKGYPQKVTLVGTNLLQSAVQKYVMCVPHQKVSMKLKFPELKENGRWSN